VLFLIQKEILPPKTKISTCDIHMQTKISFLVSSLLLSLFFSDLFSHAADVFTPFLFVSRRREVEFLKTNSYLVFEAKYTKAKGKKKNISAKDKRERGVDHML
tara:strand:- start:1704 stop:2012 length:309 start_codon:yes stop_codon:yes gene_type:complete